MCFKQGLHVSLTACEFRKTAECLQGGCVGATQGIYLSGGCCRFPGHVMRAEEEKEGLRSGEKNNLVTA